jgi:hypothetical protein
MLTLLQDLAKANSAEIHVLNPLLEARFSAMKVNKWLLLLVSRA